MDAMVIRFHRRTSVSSLARASGLKRVISGAWTMYERLQESEKRVEEEKPKLRIVLKDHDEGIRVEIVSESETMQKLAQKALDKSIEFMAKKRVHECLKTEHYLVDFPEASGKAHW